MNTLINNFNEIYVITNDKEDIIHIRDFYFFFKVSDFYLNCNKAQKRIWNYKFFRENIKINNELKHCYRDRLKYHKRYYRSVLQGVTIKD